MKQYPILLILFAGVLFSCQEEEMPEVSQDLSHVEYFGFSLIDVFFDDPSDSEVKSNYIDEVSSFSNIGDLLVINPTDQIHERVERFIDNGMKPFVYVTEIFFEVVGTDSPSGVDYQLRADYTERWNTFQTTNDAVLSDEFIAALYLGEEPTWNGITCEELTAAADHIKQSGVDIPILIIEAYPVIEELRVPSSVDWVGFDHYFIKDPATDSSFQAELSIMQSKVSSDQQIVLVMDSHYIQWAHGDFGGIELSDMADVTRSYIDIAEENKNVIAIIGYHWPNQFEFPEAIGGRGMPTDVMDIYRQIGEKIISR